MRLLPALATLAAATLLVLPAGAAGPRCGGLIRGTSASEQLTATASASRVLGMEGDDRITGSPARDCLEGGAGSDRLSGRRGGDVLVGGPGADRLIGGPGADRLTDVPLAYDHGALAAGMNRISGGGGADVADVANGRPDVVHCGGGRDRVIADRFDRLPDCERRRFLASPVPRVSPRTGRRTAMFLVRFRALEEVASSGEAFSIRVDGPRSRGCGSLVTNSLGIRYRRGAVVRYRLKPFTAGGRSARRWCRGRYRGSVTFERLAGDACAPATDEVPAEGCTESVRVGRFTFRVR
jgi:hypothetical protein